MVLLSIRRVHMNRERLHLHREANIFYLELIAPPANQTDSIFFQELADIIPQLYDDSKKIRGLIIYGQGRHFSSGANIDELKEQITKRDEQTSAELMSRSVNLFNKLAELPYPVIAAIQGCCMGSGLELALACHYRVATKNALFSLPETTYDLMPGCGATIRLPRLVGLANAIKIILSGNSFLASDGFEIGLIDHIADKKSLLATAKTMINSFQPLPLPPMK